MAKYRVTGPDGAKYEINAPEGANEAQVLEYAKGQFQKKPMQQIEPAGFGDPTSGMSTAAKFGAGAVSGVTDLAQGLGQMVGLQDRADVAKSRALEAPLKNTTAGKVGNIAGQVAAAIPTMFIPGANTVLGGAAIGAGMGLAQPSVSTEETIKNTVGGTAGGAGGVLLGRAIPKAVGGLIAPFTKSGRERMAGDTFRRFAGDNADDVIRAAQNPQQFVSGSVPTLAEVAQNPGISNLQQAMKGINPTVGNNLGERAASNMTARTGALRGIAGTADEMAQQKGVRDLMSESLYAAADKAKIPVGVQDRAISKIMERPSLQAAWGQAEKMAREAGIETVTSKGELTGNGLHFLKMSLDDQIGTAKRAGADSEVRLLSNTKEALQGWMEKNIPEYGKARTAYAEWSKPINQMEVGRVLLDKLEPALMKYAETPTRETAATFARAVQDAPRTIKGATGMQFNNLSDVMSPPAVNVVEGVAKDLARKATSEDMARAVGSNTAQNLASQNLVRSILGPMGLPQSWAESVLANSAARPIQWGMRGAEQGIQDVIGSGLLNPQLAAQLMQGARPAPTGLLGNIYQRSLPIAGYGGILATQGQQQ